LDLFDQILNFSDRMTLIERVQNVFWHLSTIDFVNLPQNLLHDENTMYQKRKTLKITSKHFKFLGYDLSESDDLWSLSRKVRVILINGERFLDFPRPLPPGIKFMGELGVVKSVKQNVPIFTGQIGQIVKKAEKLVIFSLGTVSVGFRISYLHNQRNFRTQRKCPKT
jgi:hypothetical protein